MTCHRILLPRPLPQRLAAVTLLLALQRALVLSMPTAQDAASSILPGSNGTVPDFVTRHAPLIWLHSDDPFRPADFLEHIRHTTPTVNQEPLPDVPELDLDNLAILNDISGTHGGQDVALTSNDDVSTLPTWLLGETPDASGRTVNAMPCLVILIEKSPSIIDAFYFYFYSYDRGANITQVLEPLKWLIEDDGNGMHFGNHVGDWEHNMVRFRDGEPAGIYYSQHRDGAAYEWDDDGLSLRDGRPVVYSAYGSHANYASLGDHIHDEVLIDYCDAGPLWDPILSAYFYHLDPTSFTLTRLTTSESSSSNNSSPTDDLTSFFYYNGLWGDAKYPDSHPLQKTVPYFGLKRFVSGPKGPAVKHLLRKGLAPDHPREKSWVEWAVGVLMSWYPCCLRGWRVWVSLGVFLAMVVLVVVGIVRVVRRFRGPRKGGEYKLVEGDIPLEEMESVSERSHGEDRR